jgi:two-component system chemotaxis sensor kinase CheA
MDQLLREFLAEAEDLIEALFKDIRLLREMSGHGRTRRELTASIFRHVHTLKGTAAAAGLNVASRIAHEFETLLDGVRTGRLTLAESVLDAFDDSAHALSQALDAASRGQTTQLPLQLLENLRTLARRTHDDEQHPLHQTFSVALAQLPEDIARSLAATDARRLQEATAEGQRVFVVNISFELESFDRSFRELSDALGQSGELIATLPGQTAAAPGAISFRLLYASHTRAAQLSALASAFGPASIEELPLETASPIEQAANRSDEELISEESASTSDMSASTSDKSASDNSASTEAVAPLATQVRVELGKLDELISASHDLLAETMAAFDFALEDKAAAAGGVRENMEARVAVIHRRFVQLEEQLIALRRVPLAKALERVARAGARAARALRKDVAFEVAGGDVRLDKSLVEAISDPLLHLVRNAVDHGVETPEERRSAGKSERASVRIEALAEGDRVILKIEDDGHGINLESVARAAISHGIIETGQSVTRHQAMRLIFRPGFSTATSVSEMSGRGVGLDVVERAIEQVGGEMHVKSETGQGTTFEMIIPTALALVSARIVTSAGFSYCIDASHVSDVCRVDAALVRVADGRELIDWRGMSLPLVRLRKLLGQPAIAEESMTSWPIIVVSHAKKASTQVSGETKGALCALVVDEYAEHCAEVLVRRLGAHGVFWTGVSGAAELSDGQLALVLDLPRLLETGAGAR